jgi:hypothetical protein
LIAVQRAPGDRSQYGIVITSLNFLQAKKLDFQKQKRDGIVTIGWVSRIQSSISCIKIGVQRKYSMLM